MRHPSQVKPISFLKANAADMLVRLAESREPLVIAQNGEARAVLQDVASFEETQETLALPRARRHLACRQVHRVSPGSCRPKVPRVTSRRFAVTSRRDVQALRG